MLVGSEGGGAMSPTVELMAVRRAIDESARSLALATRQPQTRGVAVVTVTDSRDRSIEQLREAVSGLANIVGFLLATHGTIP
jgi:hypothetical protein